MKNEIKLFFYFYVFEVIERCIRILSDNTQLNCLYFPPPPQKMVLVNRIDKSGQTISSLNIERYKFRVNTTINGIK